MCSLGEKKRKEDWSNRKKGKFVEIRIPEKKGSS